MKRFFLTPLISIAMAAVSFAFLIVESVVTFTVLAYREVAATGFDVYPKRLLVALTVGVSKFFRPKIADFLSRVTERRIDRYVNAAI